MILKRLFLSLFLLLSLQSFSLTLDQEIKSILRDYLSQIGGFQGAAVVNTDTGEFLGYYIVNPMLQMQKEKMAALITNVVRQIIHTTQKTNFHPIWIEVRTARSVILIVPVNEDMFLGCRFDRSTPVGLIKFQLKRAVRKLKEVLVTPSGAVIY